MRTRLRSRVALGLVTLVGLVAFGWPFLADPGSRLDQLGHGADASLVFVVIMAVLALVLLAELASGGMDAKTVAVLGVLAAAGGGLRVLSAGTAGLEPMFFLFVIAGRVLGPVRGFMMASLSLLTSAFLTAGVGPWTPFQMLACGWVAMGAGLLPRASGAVERWVLTGYGLCCGLAYGAVMNLWFWPFLGVTAPHGAGFVPGAGVVANAQHYLAFYVLTSLAWDLPRGILTAVLTFVASRPLLRALRRSVRQAAFAAPVTFAEPVVPR